jgi:3-oxoacyl-[acyl-carrier-protein] synthase-3
MSVYLRGLRCYLPRQRRTNDDLVAANPSWQSDKIYAKTGIRSRPIAAEDQTAADLACLAAEALLCEQQIDRATIDGLLFCTQSPDYLLPTTACMLQSRLRLPARCGALDYNLGCSGFTYGLWLARALVLSGSATNVLVLAADTYSRYCDLHDLSTVTIFGDAGSAALISARRDGAWACLGPSVVGTDGRGAENLIVRAGGARLPCCDHAQRPRLAMNGPEIFGFTLAAVQQGIGQLLDAVGWRWDEVDRFLLHQANGFILQRLCDSMRVPAEKLPIDLEETGNTVSASIPLLIERQRNRGLLQPGQRCVLAGFGVGYSWAMTALTWGAR